MLKETPSLYLQIQSSSTSTSAVIGDPSSIQGSSGAGKSSCGSGKVSAKASEPAALLNIPQRQKRAKKARVTLPSSSDSSDDSSDEESSDSSSDDSVSGDELSAALKHRKSNAGTWGKFDQNLSASEAIILSETAKFWNQLPDKIASVHRLGGNVIVECLTNLDTIIDKWSSLEQALKYKVHVEKAALKKTKLTVSATQQMNRDFRDTFTLVSSAPGCGAALVNFYSDRVHRVLMGHKPNDAAVSKLKAFCKLHKSLASYSFSSLAKWKNAKDYKQNNLSGRNYARRNYAFGKSSGKASGSAEGASAAKKSKF